MKNKLIPIVVISITLTAGCSSKNGRSKTENPINNESPTATQKSTKTASHVKIAGIEILEACTLTMLSVGNY